MGKESGGGAPAADAAALKGKTGGEWGGAGSSAGLDNPGVGG